MKAIARKVSISIRNLRRVLRSLEQKFAIEVTAYEDKTRSIARRYRVWGFRPAMERRRQAGYSYVYRNRNLVTLARLYSEWPPDSLTEGLGDNLSGGRTDNLAKLPPDKIGGRPTDNLSASLIRNSNNSKTTTPSPLVVTQMLATVVNTEFGLVDDDALRRIIRGCRAFVPDATDEEITEFAKVAAHRIRRIQNLDNPVGLLIKQVPKYFEGQSFRLYRDEKRRAKEIHKTRLKQLREEAQEMLENPNCESLDREWARSVIESIGHEAEESDGTSGGRV